MEYTKEELKEKFKKSPKDIQDLLLSEDLGLIAQVIAEDVGVTPENGLDIEFETSMVLLGFSHPKDFIRNVQTKIGVEEDKARAIAERVNEEIFQPVKESLKLVHNITEDNQQPTTDNRQPSAPTPVIPKPPAPPFSASQETHSAFPQMIVPPKINMEVMQKPPIPPIRQAQGEQSRAPQNIFEQKLQGVFKMPKEETLVPPKPSSPIPPPPPRSPGVDPYRELP